MRTVAGLSALFLILGSTAALAQDATLPSDSSMKMEMSRQRCYWFECRSKFLIFWA